MPACPITNEHKRYISWCKLTLVGANLHKEDPSQTSTYAYKTDYSCIQNYDKQNQEKRRQNLVREQKLHVA
jgi:hypothetical protein